MGHHVVDGGSELSIGTWEVADVVGVLYGCRTAAYKYTYHL
jgi:hypothetical protein